MGNITVFLDKTGRPMGACEVGNESEWMKDPGGNVRHTQDVAREVQSTKDEWHAWARRNAQAGNTGLCIPW